MMRSIRIQSKWSWLCRMSLMAGLMYQVAAKSQISSGVAQMSAHEIEDALQVRVSARHSNQSIVTDLRKQYPIVQDLNRHRIDTNPQTSGLTARIFAVLFPGSPAVNALLATLYISGPPSQ